MLNLPFNSFIDSEFFRKFFLRGDTYNTSYLALGNLIYYCLMNPIGYIYVNISNMNYSRRSLMHSNHERRRDFFMTILFAPIFYFIGNNISLRSQQDVDYLGIYYNKWNCIMYKYCVWTIPYWIGLQFTHFDVELFRGFSLSPEYIRQWRPQLWVVALILLAAVLGVLGYDIYCWYEIDLIWVFFAILGVEILLFVCVTVCLRKTRFLHFHHYTVAMCCIPFLGIQRPFLNILCGFVNGVMVEGGSRWGYDPIWIKKKPP